RLQLALDQSADRSRLQTERVAAQVSAEMAVRSRRDVELLAKAAQRVGGVEAPREVLAGLVVVSRHVRASPGLADSPGALLRSPPGLTACSPWGDCNQAPAQPSGPGPYPLPGL